MDVLNTTSYAILSLLSVKPWTTYELARQMERSLRSFWPSAESVVYEEPKKLARLGLATATTGHTGRRPRTTYTITPEGRAALRGWLAQPGSGPKLEFEAMIQVAFADAGSKDQLLATLRAIRGYAEEQQKVARARVSEYAETGGPFPERLPVIALPAKFFSEYANLLTRWSAWAEAEVQGWDGTGPGEATVPAGAWQSGFRRDGTSRRSGPPGATQPEQQGPNGEGVDPAGAHTSSPTGENEESRSR